MNKYIKIIKNQLFIFLIMCMLGCSKEIKPIVYTDYIAEITSGTALCYYQITFLGNGTYTSGGICWSKNPTPTISDTKIENNTGKGVFYYILTGLDQNTKYYVRAFGNSSYGVNYGNELSFTTLEKLVPVFGLSPADADGNIYTTVTYGTQTWFAENLKTTKYRNGTSIPTTTDPAENIVSLSNPAYQWAYDGNENNVSTYGRLYTWYAATNASELCPVGWHVASSDDWNILYDALGGAYYAGGPMKETGYTHWQNPNVGATNESGFTALPSGYREPTGIFYDLGFSGYWWTKTSSTNGTDAYIRWLDYNYSVAGDVTSHAAKSCAMSVRCIKD